MQVVYSDDRVPKQIKGKSIFLAGPIPRSKAVPSWRPEALTLLHGFEFKGTVFVPEYSDDFRPGPRFEYLQQVEWEWEALHRSDSIVFWVPRSLPTMPGFTTNVEFGHYLGPKVWYGRPPCAEHCRYLDWLYSKVTGRVPSIRLLDVLTKASLFIYSK